MVRIHGSCPSPAALHLHPRRSPRRTCLCRDAYETEQEFYEASKGAKRSWMPKYYGFGINQEGEPW